MPIWPLVIAVMAYALLHKGPDRLDCYDACQGHQYDAPSSLEPVDHDAIFGPRKVGPVTIDKRKSEKGER